MSETSKTVSNALSVLSCFSRSEPVLTASELARRLKLARTIVIRLLATLERFGYIEKSPEAVGYRIGLRAFLLRGPRTPRRGQAAESPP